MTLVAPRKPPAHHKKTSGKHHRHSKTYHKPYWPYLPIVGIVIAGLILGNSSFFSARKAVLGYATDMSIQGLLDGTNSQRINNGLAALALNGVLDNAAQAKANDMAARDYWSHNTPEGQTPWTFMTAAGYSYQLAGENLAYGFTNSSDTISGWMNSPGHRANILNGGYTEVGFGIVNIANYQGTGPETLVVAFYAAPTNAPAPTPAPTPTANTAGSAPIATSSKGSAGASSGGSEVAEAQPESTPAGTNSDTLVPTEEATVPISSELKNIQEPEQSHVTRSQILTAGKAPWSSLAVAIIGISAIAIFLVRHGVAWHKVIRRGEQLILHHPVLDLVFVGAAVLALILSHSAGVIR